MEELIHQLEKEIKILFHKESSGHDIYHLRRTMNTALTLQKKEGGDRIIIAVSAFLHDIHRIIQKDTDKFCSPKDSLPKIKVLLNKNQQPWGKPTGYDLSTWLSKLMSTV